MSAARVERDSAGRWCVRTAPDCVTYSTTSGVGTRRRVPVPPDAPRERAEFVARMMGMIEEEKDGTE